MSIFDYKDPIITRRRRGDSTDPYIHIEASYQIENSTVNLIEIPDELERVKVEGYGVTWLEIEEGSPNEDEYVVDYVNGLVTFHPSRDGLQPLFIFKGTGLRYVPVSMIYTQQNNGNVTETLKELVDELQNVGDVASGIAEDEERRQKNEEIRIANELKREDAEVIRQSNEQTRIDSETARDTAESIRVTNEDARQSKESERQLAESSRKSNEDTRTINENERKTNEDQRNANELIRQQQEQERQTNTQTAITNAENATKQVSDATNNVNKLVDNTRFINEYNQTTKYAKNNFVRYNGSTYISLVDNNTNNLPNLTGDTQFWALAAMRGLDGEGSVSTVNGKSPDLNGNVQLDASELGAILVTEKNIPNGVATLNSDGKVVDIDGNEIEGKVKSVNNIQPDENGNITISIPTKTSQLTNDSNFETTTGSQTKMELAEQHAKEYTDQAIANANQGEVKMVYYPYVLKATTDNQTEFTIPLESFDAVNDFLQVVQNVIILNKDEHYTVTGKTITLNQGVTIGTSLFITIIKNTLVGAEGAVNGNLIKDGSLPLNKLAEQIPTLDSNGNVLDGNGNIVEGKVKTVNNIQPDENGNVAISIPTKTSELTNDSGFSTFDGDYNNLTNKPTIPDTSDFASKSDLTTHETKIATTTELGHVKVDGTTITITENGVISTSTKSPDDTTNAPGGKYLFAGTMEEGYFGIVTSSEIITGDALASAVGISVGTSQFSTIEWLKFAYKGKIQFVPMKPIRYGISWDSINVAGCVTGKQILIKGLPYKVRLFEGALTNPSKDSSLDRGAKYSEWNRLMLPIHQQAINKNWSYPDYVESDLPNWNIGFSDSDLLTNKQYGNGAYSWCQETTESANTSRVYRGNASASFINSTSYSLSGSDLGWRPVLELVQ